MGTGVSYYLGPRFVPFDHMSNDTSSNEALGDLRGTIHHYLSVLAAVSVLLLAAVIVYFPARPPSPPPGPAHVVEKADFSKGWGPVRKEAALQLVVS